MGAFIYWTTDLGVSKILWFDVTTEEGHHLKSEVTEHPVEEGSDIADHVRPDNDRISLSLFVSNTPIVSKTEVDTNGRIGVLYGAQDGAVIGHDLDVQVYSPPLLPTPGSALNALTSAISNALFGKKQYKAQTLTFAEEFDNVQEVYDTLREIREDAVRVNIVTSVKTYSDMILENVEMNKTADTGTGARFQIEAKQIRVVSTLKVKAPRPAESLGFQKKNLGAKPPNTNTPQRESVLHKGISGLGNATGVNIFGD